MNNISILFLTVFNCCNLITNNDKIVSTSNDTSFIYDNSLYKFSLSIPTGFEVSEEFPNSLLTIYRKQGEKPDPTNMTLRVNRARGTLEEYYTFNKSQLKREMPNAKIVFEAKVKISKYYCYITDVELLNNDDLLYCRLFTFLESGKGFHFSLVSKFKEFDKAKVDFTSILQTLKIE